MLYKDKIFSKVWFKDAALIVIGTFSLAVGMVFFIAPYKFVPGGVYGISIVIHHLLGTPIGLVSLCMDIPLLLIGIKVLGSKFGVKTFVGIVLTAVFVDTLGRIWGNDPLVEGDALLSGIFGGVLVGLGLGLVFRARATSGGTDIVAMILSKYTRLPLGQSLIYIDSAIVLIGLVAFRDWKIPLYSWLIIFITGKVIDTVVEGYSVNKVVMVISDKHEEIREKIIFNMERGGTYLNAQGMYEGADKKVIYTNISRRELPILLAYIRDIDPTAFVSVIDAHDVLGDGFKPLKEE
ncbi:MAG: YitT family protein [Bacteroidales bacterium]|jgi:uncharacterized membrane-anchored protein YitT (DUF2179 family)|nr:YitT family protein [Bacteroidales bacterium]